MRYFAASAREDAMRKTLVTMSLAASILAPLGARGAEGCVTATGVNGGHCAYAPTGAAGYLAAADSWSIDARDFFGEVVTHFGSDVGSDPVGLPGAIPAAYVIEAWVLGTGTLIVGDVP
jgi:hypothetical protein